MIGDQLQRAVRARTVVSIDDAPRVSHALTQECGIYRLRLAGAVVAGCSTGAA